MAGKETLLCEVCFESYDDLNKVPKFLQCYHTHCLPCLKALLSNGVIKCPTCHRETRITKEDEVEKLQTNFYVNTSSDEKKKFAKETVAAQNVLGECNEGINCKRRIHEKLIATDGEIQAGITARRELAQTLEIVTASFQNIFQELLELKKYNWQKLKHVERCVEDMKRKTEFDSLSDKPGSSAKVIPKEQNGTQTTFETLNKLFDRLRVECKAAVSSHRLLSSMEKIPFSLNVNTSLNIKGLTAGIFQQPLQQDSESDVARERQSLVALSYIVFINTDLGKNWYENFQNGDTITKENLTEKNKKTVAESINKSAVEKLDENRNVSSNKYNDFNGKRPYAAKPTNSQLLVDASLNEKVELKYQKPAASQPIKLSGTKPNKTTESPIRLSNSLPNSLMKPKCHLGFQVNGKPFGRITIELFPDLAPTMSRRFLQLCDSSNAVNYCGSTVRKSEAGAYIIGGRSFGSEDMFDADPSPLKRCRGAVFFRLKCDISKTRRSIVSSEFIIQLNDEKKDSTWTSTVFGYVCGGLQECDRISRIDCSKSSVVITSTGIVN